MEFAEYRQPWETGPHWELKREFLEYYKNDFPIDRLLCLAQAYSNVKLMMCSYPAQVMLQIHELSKPLKGCKILRRNENAQSNNQSAQKQQGKRKNNEPASSQKFKFIKFCSGSEESPKLEANESKHEPQSPSFGNIDYESIAKPENFHIFKKLSEEVKKILSKLSNEKAYDVILSAALHSNIEDLIDIKFANQTRSGTRTLSDRYYCEFYIGATKIATGEGDNRFAAKSKASENALYILKNLKEFPKKSSEDAQTRGRGPAPIRAVQETSSNHSQNVGNLTSFQSDSNTPSQNLSARETLKKLALDMKKNYHKNPSALTFIHNYAMQMKIVDDVVFKVSVDSSLPKHVHLCDLFIKNILIGQGEASKLKVAKREAAENGFKYLMNLVENDSICDSIMSEEISKGETSCQEFNNSSNSEGETPKDKNAPWKSKSDLKEVIRTPLNKELLNNSYKQQFLIFDRTEVLDFSENAAAILSCSAHMCRKNYSYNFVTNDDGTTGAEVLLDNIVFGTGVGPSKQAAKNDAAKNTLECLQTQVYTVKVKAGMEEGFHVNRNDMLELSCDAPAAVSDDNIGCRMLKMMGWSGGGIGKKEGISEPIRAGSQNYGTGLGYADLSGKMDMKSLKTEIETLLQEFSKSDAVVPIIFSLDFTKSERKEIHRIAQKYNLSNNSYGKNEARRLFIKRKIGVTELLDYIVKAGGCTKKYELVDMSKI